METRLLSEIMRRLYTRGLVEVKGGNASVKVNIGGLDLVLITPGGVEKDRINTDEIAVIDLNGNIVYGRPSSEYRLHLEIYRGVREARAVIHAHNPLATVLARSVPLEPFAGEAFNTCITLVEYYPSGTLELARATAEKISSTGCRLAILERHGVVAVGVKPEPREALLEALEMVESVELAARRALALLASLPSLLYHG